MALSLCRACGISHDRCGCPWLGRVGLYLEAQLGYLAAGVRVTLLPYSASKDPVGGAAWRGLRQRILGFDPISDIEFRKSGQPDRRHRLIGRRQHERGRQLMTYSIAAPARPVGRRLAAITGTASLAIAFAVAASTFAAAQTPAPAPAAPAAPKPAPAKKPAKPPAAPAQAAPPAE